MLRINELNQLDLGIQGENECRTITIDVSAWLSIYPNGSVTIWHRRNGDSVPSATGAVMDAEAGTISWTPTDTDTYNAGEGMAEIRLSEGDVIKKSRQVKTNVSNAVTLAGTTVGSDWQSYINAVDGLRAAAVDAQEAAEDAQEAAEDAQEAAENARDAAQAAAGDFQGLTATVEGLAAGEDPTLEVTHEAGGLYQFAFGIPKGDKGDTGYPTDEQVTTAVDAYLEEAITNPSSPPLDRTLTSTTGATPADMAGNLKDGLNKTLIPNTFTPTLTNGKYIKFTDGTIASSTKYARTNLWNGAGMNRVAVELTGTTYEMAMFWYDATGDLSDGTGYLGHSAYMPGMIYIPKEAAKFGLSFRRIDQEVLADADITAIGAALKLYGQTDTTVSVYGQPADAQSVRVQHFAVNGKIIDSDFEQGGYTGSGGAQTNSKRVRTKYVFFAQKGTYVRGFMSGLYYYVWEMKTSDISTANNIYGSSGWIDGKDTYMTRFDAWILITVANGQTGGSSTDITPSDLAGKYCLVGNKSGETAEYLQTKQVSNVTQGGYSSSSGTNTDAKKLRIAKMEFVPAGSTVLFSIGSLYCYIWELSSNSAEGGNLLTTNGGWKQLTKYTVRNNCWLMMSFQTAETASGSSNITPEDFAGYYWQIFATPNAENVIRAMYGTTDADLANNVMAYAARMAGKTEIESFVFFTDLHIVGGWNWRNVFADAVKRIGTVYDIAPVDFCVFGGDALTRDSSYDENITPAQAIGYLAYQDKVCRDQFGDGLYLPAAGNHDYNYNGTATMEESEIVNAMFRRWRKAYYKYNGNTSTVYVLNTGENHDTNMNTYRWNQIDWLGKTLAEDDPPHAIIVMHIIKNNNTNHTLIPMFNNANALSAAFNSRGSVTLNGETYDFTSNTGRVEFFLGGHLHTDLTYDGIENGIPYVMRTASGLTSVVPSFDCVLCDWEGREVTFHRFGSGYSMRIDLDTGEETVENE